MRAIAGTARLAAACAAAKTSTGAGRARNEAGAQRSGSRVLRLLVQRRAVRADRAYSPFTVYTLLEHGGDFAPAAAALRAEGFGERRSSGDVDLSRIVCQRRRTGRHRRPSIPIPAAAGRVLPRAGFHLRGDGPLPGHGTVPERPAGVLRAARMQAVLAGRKVRDQADNRSNLYLLALAYSSVGKDWPRKVNTFVLHRAGLVESLGEKFASGEGIQDSLFRTPAMLFQTDEIDGLLQSINKAQDARHENILGTLLTMYSASNSIFPMRRKAGKESPGVIDQPCLVVYGTAIPTHYYDALSERMLTNGFFARMLIVESGPRSVGQEPGIIDLPSRVHGDRPLVGRFLPRHRQLGAIPPPAPDRRGRRRRSHACSPRPVRRRKPSMPPPRPRAIRSARQSGDACPSRSASWRSCTRSAHSHESPRIDVAAVRWATDFILHQTRRMLFMAHSHVAENPFHAECLKLLRKLREAPDRQLAHSVLLKRMKIDAKTFQELITTLEEQGDITTVIQPTTGRPQRVYQLVGVEQAGEGAELDNARE